MLAKIILKFNVGLLDYKYHRGPNELIGIIYLKFYLFVFSAAVDA